MGASDRSQNNVFWLHELYEIMIKCCDRTLDQEVYFLGRDIVLAIIMHVNEDVMRILCLESLFLSIAATLIMVLFHLIYMKESTN